MQFTLRFTSTATYNCEVSVIHIVLFADEASFQVVFNFGLTLSLTGRVFFHSFEQMSCCKTDITIGYMPLDRNPLDRNPLDRKFSRLKLIKLHWKVIKTIPNTNPNPSRAE